MLSFYIIKVLFKFKNHRLWILIHQYSGNNEGELAFFSKTPLFKMKSVGF